MASRQDHVYKLLGAEPSPFTAKVRSYLKWNRIPFKEVIASENVYRDLILPLTKVSFLPVLLVYDGPALEMASKQGAFDPPPLHAIQDTKVIMDYFEQMNQVPNTLTSTCFLMDPLVPKSPQLAFASMIFELLADEWLINQAIYWRWGKGNFEKQRDFLAFDYGSFATGGISSFEKAIENGEKKLTRLRQVLPLLGVDDDTSPAFRRQFMILLKRMSAHLSRYPFLLGMRISLADFAFFGSFYAHLSRDPVPSFTIKTEAPLVFEWVERIGGSARWAGLDVDRWDSNINQWRATLGESKFEMEIPPDETHIIPASSAKVIELLLEDYILVLRDTLTRTLHYLDEIHDGHHGKRPGDVSIKLPRTLGRHGFRVRSSTDDFAYGERNVYTHSIWMLDRIIKRTYNSHEQRAVSDKWLETFENRDILRDWKDCVASWSASRWNIEREENKLVARKRFEQPKPNL